jgi:hypothetical protein
MWYVALRRSGCGARIWQYPARLIAGAWHADCRAAAGIPSGKIMPPPRENGTP